MAFFRRNRLERKKGKPYPLGLTYLENGYNFSVFSKNGNGVKIHFFREETDEIPFKTYELDPNINKTGNIWHIQIVNLPNRILYCYTVDGEYNTINGNIFNDKIFLLDPYSKAVQFCHTPNKIAPYKAMVLNFEEEKALLESDPEWLTDKPLGHHLKDLIIYETHIRAFTKDKSSNVKHKGTYMGMVEKIPYLKELGINAIELLPIHFFEPYEFKRFNPKTKQELINFWGYSTLNFFSPTTWYASENNPISAIREFRILVKELHKAGIEVILDVVYNHTGEGNELGPTISFKGFDNSIYYMLYPANKNYYLNYSGCGNTFNCNHPVVKELILNSLRYWVTEMHVDGFRFDLAAILGRQESGDWMPNLSILQDIVEDPILNKSKIIAESWDAAGIFEVGGFPIGWAEWNALYRDDIRSFVRGDQGKLAIFAKRITGSPDIFKHNNRKPYHSINFITAHDGFTLNDLVSFNEKNNFENGEDNQDGSNNNISANYGVEGATNNNEINNIREKQMKNFFTVIMLSIGTPMILSGDEIKFTKNGNNNTYCQDNSLNFLDWNLIKKNKNYFNFVKEIIKFRKETPGLRRKGFLEGKDIIGNSFLDIKWYGVDGESLNWEMYDAHCLSFFINKIDDKENPIGKDENNIFIYVLINMFNEDKVFTICEKHNQKWKYKINTELENSVLKNDLYIENNQINVKSRSIIVLTAD